MEIKRVFTNIVLLLLLSTATQAQEVKTDPINGNDENPNEQTNLSTITNIATQDVKYENRMNKVWKQRAR